MVRFVFEIKLESYKKNDTTVKIIDHLPLPTDDEITVKDMSLKPEPKKRDERNIVTWDIPVKPKEKKTIRIEFSIEYPKGKQLFGVEGGLTLLDVSY